MKRRRALLKYDDAPPSASGLEVSVYLADEVDEVLKRQASAALAGMNAAKAISSHDLERAARLRAESSPDALESERQANAKLTQELSLAEEGLANYAQENERLKAALERIQDERLTWAMTCHPHECAACDLLDKAIRASQPQPDKHK